MCKKILATTAIAGVIATAMVLPVQAQADKSIFELGAAEAKQTSKDYKEFKPAPEKIISMPSSMDVRTMALKSVSATITLTPRTPSVVLRAFLISFLKALMLAWALFVAKSGS